MLAASVRFDFAPFGAAGWHDAVIAILQRESVHFERCQKGDAVWVSGLGGFGGGHVFGWLVGWLLN
jgi:hypothetical protein